MHILLHVAGHVEVDHMLHVGDVKASSGHCCGNDDRGLTALEAPERWPLDNLHESILEPQSLLSLTLSPVSMDGGDREALAMKELVQRVGSTLRFHEDQGPRGLGKSHYEHEFENGNFGASIRLFTPTLLSLDNQEFHWSCLECVIRISRWIHIKLPDHLQNHSSNPMGVVQ